MAVVNIFRNTDHKHAKRPPSPADAVKAWDNLGVAGSTAVSVPKDPVTAEHTSVTFSPPETGHYETTYPAELAAVVKGGARAQSWVFDW